MKHAHAFDPATGTPLSDERFVTTPSGAPEHVSVTLRTPVQHPSVGVDDWSDREGSLTNGEIRSAQQGLLGHFRRVHRKVRTPDGRLDSAAALAIKRLKAANEQEPDAFVWLALAERLSQKGHWVAWMLEHFVPRCPHCESVLKYRAGAFSADSICASAPSDHGTVDEAIRDRTLRVYHAAFDDRTFETFVDEFDPTFV